MIETLVTEGEQTPVESTETLKNAVRRTADVAHIGIDESEVETFVSDIRLIDESVELLANIERSDDSKHFFISEHDNVMRKDEVAPSLPREAALANAPKVDEHCFWVPRILDEGSEDSIDR